MPREQISLEGDGQMSFPFEAPRPEKNIGSGEGHDFSHIENDDECQYCGQPFESASTGCQHCVANRRKKAYLEKLKKKN